MNKLQKLFNTKIFWLQVAFLISLTAVLGSVLLEYILGLTPCELCWWQRVFMYPLPFIFGAALAKKHTDVFWYGFPLAAIGAAIALFHYWLQMWPQSSDVCGGSIVSCAVRQIELLGFITIPFGSLLAFAGVLVALIMLRRAED